jgi:hypothetical protein
MVKLIVEWPDGVAVSDISQVDRLVRKTGGKGMFVAPDSASTNSAMDAIALVSEAEACPTYVDYMKWRVDNRARIDAVVAQQHQ